MHKFWKDDWFRFVTHSHEYYHESNSYRRKLMKGNLFKYLSLTILRGIVFMIVASSAILLTGAVLFFPLVITMFTENSSYMWFYLIHLLFFAFTMGEAEDW